MALNLALVMVLNLLRCDLESLTVVFTLDTYIIGYAFGFRNTRLQTLEWLV